MSTAARAARLTLSVWTPSSSGDNSAGERNMHSGRGARASSLAKRCAQAIAISDVARQLVMDFAKRILCAARVAKAAQMLLVNRTDADDMDVMHGHVGSRWDSRLCWKIGRTGLRFLYGLDRGRKIRRIRSPVVRSTDLSDKT